MKTNNCDSKFNKAVKVNQNLDKLLLIFNESDKK